MFRGRLNLLVRHFSRPILANPIFASLRPPPPNSILPPVSPASSVVSLRPSSSRASIMTSSAVPRTPLIQTAACLIIGDEVLGGKTVDTNSTFFSRWCFLLGIQLKRIEVIADNEDEIIEAVRRMSSRYDFVVTSGGIGPTHDDITYSSIAKAFGLSLKLHQPAFERMKLLSKPHPLQPNFDWNTPSPALTAKLRMVELPYDPRKPDAEQAIFVADDLWVPIAIVNGNVHVLPGVPRLFERLLTELKPLILPRLANPEGKGIHRFLFSTQLPESAVAPHLTELAAQTEPRGVKIGSYPRWGKKRNTVTLVGGDAEYMESLAPTVEKCVQAKRVLAEDELDSDIEESK